jgi:uncharacterized protein (DUF58 family)
MIRPTRRAALLFAGLLPLPWLLLSYRPSLWRWAFDVSAVLVAAMGVDAVLARPRRPVAVKVRVPETALIGEPIEAEVEITAGLGLPAGYEVALDLSGDARPKEVATLQAAGRDMVSITTAQRGLMYVDAVWLRWRGPLRLMEQTRHFAIGGKTAVIPNTRAARGDELSLFFQDALSGLKVQRGAGEGSEFEALREYVPGLDSRFIDWKRSARHREMLVREFRVERNHPVMLAFDTGYLMREPINEVPRLDHAISAGLLLARLAINAGDLVGTYSFDSRPRQYLPPARGLATFRRLQQASAALAYSHDETNFTLGLAELQTRLPRRSVIVLFTDFVDTITAELLLQNMRRLTNKHLLVFVSVRDGLLKEIFDAAPNQTRQIARAVLADDFMKERQLVLEKLERMGIHCIDAAPNQLSPALLNRYLTIKQRGLL